MRYGYSNLLSETIEASRLDHADCRRFQIVCPVCREPVFKAARELPAPSHYLSHYVASNAYAAECELRVAGFDVREIEAQNILSRGQKLTLFLRVLREAVMTHEYRWMSANPKTLMGFIERSKALGFLRGLLAGMPFDSTLERANFSENARFYIEQDIGAGHAMWQGALGRELREQIAFDMWLTLLSPPARANLNFLWNHGYVIVLARDQTAHDQGVMSEPMRVLWGYMAKLCRTSRKKGMALLAEMQQRPTPAGFALPGNNYLDKMMAEVAHEMIGCLLRLPYLDILSEQQKKQ